MAEGTELLRRYVADRSEAAFAALIQQHLALVYHAALRRTNGDTHLAEEVAQTVFTNLAREAGTLQHHAVLTGWLYVATRHAAANAMRSELRRKRREQEAKTMNEPTTDETSGVDWARLRPEIDSVMDELTEADRNAVLLRYFENRPYAEIGASLRITEDAARMRVERALEKLRMLLARRGITSSAAALGGLLAAQSALAAPAGLATAVTGSVMAGTGAAVTATGTAGFMAFMTTNKIVLGVAGAVAALSIGTAWHQFQDNRRLTGELAVADRDTKALQTQLEDQMRLVRRTEEDLRQAQAKATESEVGGSSPGASQTAKPKSTSTRSGSMTIITEMPFGNPDFVQLQLKMGEMTTKLQYGPLYRRLGWGQEKIRAFEQLLLQQQQNSFDILAAASVNGVPLNSPELNKQWNDPVVQETGDKLRQLLGEKDHAAFLEYSDVRSSIARSSLDTLAGNLYYTDTPLMGSQAEQLEKLIVQHTIKPAQTSGVVETPRPDWETIYAQATTFLTPAQLATFRTANLRNDLSLESHKMMMKLMKEAGANASK